MIEKTLEVTNEEGFHTRPANNFVKEVKSFESEVTLKKGDKVVPGKSLLKIMKLGIIQGDTVSLVCDGPDEQDAFNTLSAIIQPVKSTS